MGWLAAGMLWVAASAILAPMLGRHLKSLSDDPEDDKGA